MTVIEDFVEGWLEFELATNFVEDVAGVLSLELFFKEFYSSNYEKRAITLKMWQLENTLWEKLSTGRHFQGWRIL